MLVGRVEAIIEIIVRPVAIFIKAFGFAPVGKIRVVPLGHRQDKARRQEIKGKVTIWRREKRKIRYEEKEAFRETLRKKPEAR